LTILRFMGFNEESILTLLNNLDLKYLDIELASTYSKNDYCKLLGSHNNTKSVEFLPFSKVTGQQNLTNIGIQLLAAGSLINIKELSFYHTNITYESLNYINNNYFP